MVSTVLLCVAGVLLVVEVARTRGAALESLTFWAVGCIDVALLVTRL